MKNVILVFGGRSYEHDISIVTASQIYLKTRLDGVSLVPLYISKNNRFFVYLNQKFNLKDFAVFDENKHSKYFKEIVFVSGENCKLFSKTLFGLKEYLYANIAIMACHGGDGENGKLVSFFKQFKIYSSASGVEGLAISMNKILFKNFMKAKKLPVVSGFVVNQQKFIEKPEIYKNKFQFLSFPVIIKPLNGGSSIGLFVAKNKDEFRKMLFEAFEFDDDVIVEKFISNAREFNVAVLGDSTDCLVSEVDEPLKISEVLSFEDKYFSSSKMKGGAKSDNSMLSQNRKFPAKISEELRKQLRTLAKTVFCELNLTGVVRIDFLFDELNNKVYICEVNAIPGSLSYYFFERGKVLINDFVYKLIEIAEKNSKAKSDIKTEFITKII